MLRYKCGITAIAIAILILTPVKGLAEGLERDSLYYKQIALRFDSIKLQKSIDSLRRDSISLKPTKNDSSIYYKLIAQNDSINPFVSALSDSLSKITILDSMTRAQIDSLKKIETTLEKDIIQISKQIEELKNNMVLSNDSILSVKTQEKQSLSEKKEATATAQKSATNELSDIETRKGKILRDFANAKSTKTLISNSLETQKTVLQQKAALYMKLDSTLENQSKSYKEKVVLLNKTREERKKQSSIEVGELLFDNWSSSISMKADNSLSPFSVVSKIQITEYDLGLFEDKKGDLYYIPFFFASNISTGYNSPADAPFNDISSSSGGVLQIRTSRMYDDTVGMTNYRALIMNLDARAIAYKDSVKNTQLTASGSIGIGFGYGGRGIFTNNTTKSPGIWSITVLANAYFVPLDDFTAQTKIRGYGGSLETTFKFKISNEALSRFNILASAKFSGNAFEKGWSSPVFTFGTQW